MQRLALSLTLTPRSCTAIQRAVAAAGIAARHRRKGTEYRFAVEAQPAETDYVVEQHGARVYVDPFSAQDVDGGTIDYVPAGEEHVFTLTPPRLSARAPKLVA
jgi:Fe-S cluster assembly iron-binding protein IscA